MLNDNESGFVRMHMVQAVQVISDAWTRPSVVYRPVISLDGDQWCALLGENIQVGVAGFGDSPEKAMAAFDSAWVASSRKAGA